MWLLITPLKLSYFTDYFVLKVTKLDYKLLY